MSEKYTDDADWATAAEQSSEDDEAQEGSVLAAEERSVESAEHAALHIEEPGVDADDDTADLDEIDVADPEADAIVNDALEIDQAAEAEAAAEVLTESLADEEAEREAEEADEVTPYDGPDINGEPDAPVLDEDFVADVTAAESVVDEAEAAEDAGDAAQSDETDEDDEDADPYEAFRAELRALEGKWYVIHSYAGFERKVKANIEQRKSTLEVEEEIYQVEVPMEDVVEIKNGQRKMVTRVRIPGYVLVRMELTEDTWSVVRHTPGVTGFV
ncbi:MAG: transcription termination/antitermination factor NusG, partial [Microbacterium sp.]|nr:transcription termination/antitermination factor NusG [Microbacterium sp.]